MSRHDFVILGLQRSGTNFLEQCLKKNIRNLRIANKNDDGIWKHSYGSNNNLNLNKIMIVKHPYSWVDSIVRNNQDIKKRYIRVVKTKDTKYIIDDFNLDELIRLWNDFNNYWLEQNIEYVIYEHIISSYESIKEVILRVTEKYSYELIFNENKLIIPNKVGQSRPFTEEMRYNYLNYKLYYLSWENVIRINSIIDHHLLNIFNYNLITTEDEYSQRKYK